MLLCQFLVLAGNRQFFCCGGKVLLRPEIKVPVVCLAGCAAVSVFGCGDYDRKKKFQSSVWRVVLLCQFLVMPITTGKKSSSCLSGGLCCCVSFGSGDYDLKKKKFQVVLLCQFLVLAITTGKKKVPVVCLAGCAVVSVFGSGDYDRKKKVLVVCLAGCAVVSVFGSGGK